MVKLRVIRGFRDLEAGVHRKPGEVFEASDARARVILRAGVAEAMETTDEAAEAAKKQRSKRKKG